MKMMKVEMLRGTVYRGDTLEMGRAYEVDEEFGNWMIAKGKAKPYTPIPMAAVEAQPAVSAKDLEIPPEKRVWKRRGTSREG